MYVACVIYLEKYVLEDTCDLTKTALYLYEKKICVMPYVWRCTHVLYYLFEKYLFWYKCIYTINTCKFLTIDDYIQYRSKYI